MTSPPSATVPARACATLTVVMPGIPAHRADMSHTVYRSRTGYNERHVDPSRTRCPGTHPGVPVRRRFGHRPALRRPAHRLLGLGLPGRPRSDEHTSELQSLMRISYAVFCLSKKT